jgi:hypothetical protein
MCRTDIHGFSHRGKETTMNESVQVNTHPELASLLARQRAAFMAAPGRR